VIDLWVVNASPVITLAKVKQLHLLEKLSGSLLLPTAVATEILAGGASDPARMFVASGWGQRATPSIIPHAVIEWGLGGGETAVLALAIERGPAMVVLDDASARTAARTLNLPVIGTLGVIVQAKLREFIPSAADVIADLRAAGLFLDQEVVAAVLQQLGE
jgi:predicted nucleic acid-binding protein